MEAHAAELLVQLAEPAQGDDSEGIIRAANETARAWQNTGSSRLAWSLITVEPQLISRGVRERMMHGDCNVQLVLANLYLQVLASEGSPVPELFDAFCFSLAWQSLHAYCRDAVCGDQGSPHKQADWPTICGALLVTLKVLDVVDLKGQPEAFQSICENCSGMLRLAASVDKRSKGSHAGDSNVGQVVTACIKVLEAVVDIRNVTARSVLVNSLQMLAPGLLGSTGLPSSMDTSKPNAAVRDATVQLLYSLQLRMPKEVNVLLHGLLLKAPEKAAMRNMLTEAVDMLTAEQSNSMQAAWIQFVALLSYSPVASQRLLALQILDPMLDHFLAVHLTSFLGEVESEKGFDTLPQSPDLVLLSLCVRCCVDKSSIVRSKAMSTLAKTISSILNCSVPSARQRSWLWPFTRVVCRAEGLKLDSDVLLRICQSGKPGDGKAEDALQAGGDGTPLLPSATEVSPAGSSRYTASEYPCTSFASLVEGAQLFSWVASAAEHDAIGHMLLVVASQAADCKATVRKSSVQLSMALYMLIELAEVFEFIGLAQTALQHCQRVLQATARDAAVSVRKAAVEGAAYLTETGNSTHNSDICMRLWAQVVVPRLHDAEASVQQAAIQQVWSKLVEPAMSLDSDAASGKIRAVCSTHVALQAGLERVCKAQKDKIKPSAFCAAFQQHLSSGNAMSHDERVFYWTLMTEVSSACSGGASVAFMVSSWESLVAQIKQALAASPLLEEPGLQDEAAAVLRAIAASTQRLQKQQVATMAREMYILLESCQLSGILVAPLVRVLSLFSMILGIQPGSCRHKLWQTGVTESCFHVAVTCLEQLQDALGKSPGGISCASLATHIKKASNALFTLGHVALESGEALGGRVLTLIQALTLPTKLQQHSTALSPKLDHRTAAQLQIPSVLQASAWAALGKVCLVDETLSVTTAPLLVNELRRSALPAVRNNLLMALCDMCMQYTLVVDAHLGTIAQCMQDPHPLLRKQALALLAGLLQKEFVKWRGPLFVQFVLALVDESPTVRTMARTLLVDIMGKVPTLAHNHFLEIMFMLNSCSTLRRKACKQLGAQEGKMNLEISSCCTSARLMGPSNSASRLRFTVYKALLAGMQPQHKLALLERITEEVLHAVADGAIALLPAEQVVRDALRLITLPEMQIDVKRSVLSDDDVAAAAVAGEETASQVDALQGRFSVAAVLVKRHALERVVPAVIALKAALEEQRHPLQAAAMACLVDLLAEHKADMEAVLASHRQLAAEVRFHMAEARRARREVGSGGKTPPTTAPRGREVASPCTSAPFLPTMTPPLHGGGDRGAGTRPGPQGSGASHMGNVALNLRVGSNLGQPGVTPVVGVAGRGAHVRHGHSPTPSSLTATMRPPRLLCGSAGAQAGTDGAASPRNDPFPEPAGDVLELSTGCEENVAPNLVSERRWQPRASTRSSTQDSLHAACRDHGLDESARAATVDSGRAPGNRRGLRARGGSKGGSKRSLPQ